MIVFDTETTGFVEPLIKDLKKQPKAIEIAAIKLNDKTLKEVDRFETLINPQQPIEHIITEITGITNDDLKDQPTFGQVYGKLWDFFSGEKIWVAHNVEFDLNILLFELMRIEKQHAFPYPKRFVCTSEETTFLNNGKRLKLTKLHELATGKPLENAHRAINDVEGTVRCLKWLRKEHQFI